jgi:hypothetical protein
LTRFVRASTRRVQPAINLIDTNTFEVTNLLPGNELPAQLSISADSSSLLIAKPSAPHLERIDLESLQTLPNLAIPLSYSALLEGVDDWAYISGVGGVNQLNSATGAVQRIFAPSFAPQIAISSDRRTLFVAHQNALSVYDISASEPLLVATLAGSFSYPTPSLDGRYLYYVRLSQTDNCFRLLCLS